MKQPRQASLPKSTMRDRQKQGMCVALQPKTQTSSKVNKMAYPDWWPARPLHCSPPNYKKPTVQLPCSPRQIPSLVGNSPIRDNNKKDDTERISPDTKTASMNTKSFETYFNMQPNGGSLSVFTNRYHKENMKDAEGLSTEHCEIGKTNAFLDFMRDSRRLQKRPRPKLQQNRKRTKSL